MPRLQNLEGQISHLNRLLDSTEEELANRSKIASFMSYVLGFKTDDENDALLLKKPNKYIATKDLQRKIILIKEELAELQLIHNALVSHLETHKKRQAEARIQELNQKEQEKLLAQKDMKAKHLENQKKNVLDMALRDNGVSFYAELEENHKEVLRYINSYKGMDEAIEHGFSLAKLQNIATKISVLYDNKLAMNTYQLWQCANVLDATIMLQKDAIQNDEDLLAEYQKLHKRILKFLLPQLDIELKLLKVLFVCNEHELIVNFLRQYSAVPEYNVLFRKAIINNIEKVTEELYLKSAKEILVRQCPMFEKLNIELQNSLIEQQAYILLLEAHYNFIGGKTQFQENQLRRDYLAKFALNIAKAIDLQDSNDAIVTSGRKEYQDIKTKLAKIESDARNNFLIDAVVSDIKNVSVNAPRKLIQKMQELYNAPSTANSPFSPMVYGLIALQLCYLYFLGYMPSLTSLKNVFNLAMLAPGAALTKKTIEANTVVFAQIENEVKILEQLPDFDAAFINAEEKFWHASESLQSVANIDLNQVENKYFQEKYDESLKFLQDFFKEKETKIKDEFRKFVNDSTSSSKELFFDFVKVMSGVVLVVTGVLMTVFALSGLTGPFFFFAFVPALSTSIIAGLAVIAAKLNFEGNSTANKLIDSFVWICYSPVVFLFSGLEFMFRPVNSVLEMVLPDNDGNAPSKKDKIIGIATIALGLTMAVGLGVGMPFLAPILGISIGLAATIGLLCGAYSGLTLGVIAKKTYDRIINRPTVKIVNAKDKLSSILELNNESLAKLDRFKNEFPTIAPELLQVLENRAKDIQKDINTLEAKLPSLFKVATTEIKKIPEVHQNDHKEPVKPEIQDKLEDIARKIAILQNNYQNLLNAFDKYEAARLESNKQALKHEIAQILLSEFELSKAEFKAESLAIAQKTTQPGYKESIKPALLFNNDLKSFTLVDRPNFALAPSHDYAKQREKLNNLHKLRAKLS